MTDLTNTARARVWVEAARARAIQLEQPASAQRPVARQRRRRETIFEVGAVEHWYEPIKPVDYSPRVSRYAGKWKPLTTESEAV